MIARMFVFDCWCVLGNVAVIFLHKAREREPRAIKTYPLIPYMAPHHRNYVGSLQDSELEIVLLLFDKLKLKKKKLKIRLYFTFTLLILFGADKVFL